MPKSSDRIKYPRTSLIRPSRNTGLTGKTVLIAIITLLGEVVDLVESLDSGGWHLFKRKNTALAVAQKKLCDGIVDGANSLTELFNRSVANGRRLPHWKPPRKFKAFLPVFSL